MRALLSTAPMLSILASPALQDAAPAADDAPRFVEEVRVLHEWRGEAAGDQFGWEARDVGDADGDGVHDAVVSAPFKALEGPNAGRVYLYSGASGAELFRHDGAPGDFLGAGISGCGDVDGDGRADWLAGAVRWRGAPGYALVLSGATGEVLHRLASPDAEPADEFGWKVAGAGDLDGDGRPDVLVGAPGTDAGGVDRGRAYAFSGADGSLLFELDGERDGDRFGGVVGGDAGGSRLLVVGAGNAGPDQRGLGYVYRVGPAPELEPELFFVVEPEPKGTNLGRMFGSVVGDVDGDGTPDVYVSDWEDALKGPNTGRVYVHSGADGERLHDLSGEAAGEGFGIGDGEVGDVDGDGCDDLVIGAWQSAAGAPSGGRVDLCSGRTGALLRRITCAVPGETFGFDAAGLGDVDGDGAIDLLVTGAYSAVRGAQSGRVLVLAGAAAAPAEGR